MLIIGFGVTEVLLSTLVFTCETCGNNAPHQLTKQNRKFSLLGRHEIPRRLYRLWANHRGQQGAGRGSGPAGRPGPALIRLELFASAHGRLTLRAYVGCIRRRRIVAHSRR